MVDTQPVTDRAFGPAILVLSGLQLLVVLDGTVANLALPELQDDLGLSDAGRNWAVVAYALAFGGLMLLGGRLGDRFGRKKMFLCGVTLFTVSSLLCGAALNGGMLIAARALQGSGAAIASPAALALIATTFAAGPARNKAIAISAAMSGAGSFTGLILGGALTDLSWRWIFLINVPIGALIIPCARKVLAETADEPMELDVLGAVLATTGCTALVFGVSMGAELGWTDPVVAGGVIGGLVLLAVFLRVERTAARPLLPLRLFAERDRLITFVSIAFAAAALFCGSVYIAQFVQNILHYSALRAGFAFVPFGLGLALGSAVASKLAARIPPRTLVFAGGLIVVPGLIFGSTLDSGAHYLTDLMPPILAIGFGIGLAVVPLPLCALVGVGDEEIGPLTAITSVAQTLSGPVALAVIGGMATARTRALGGIDGPPSGMTAMQLDALGKGYTFALLGCAVCAALAAMAALFIRLTARQVAMAQHAQEANSGG
ncbi:MFS transporter [Nocardia sp. NPDC088792]|uniref:MFS transporter n=1 Tax=Nocardia sp. NPDC088792 TaxID=3364332 RepID=UPI0038089A75